MVFIFILLQINFIAKYADIPSNIIDAGMESSNEDGFWIIMFEAGEVGSCQSVA